MTLLVGKLISFYRKKNRHSHVTVLHVGKKTRRVTHPQVVVIRSLKIHDNCEYNNSEYFRLFVHNRKSWLIRAIRSQIDEEFRISCFWGFC